MKSTIYKQILKSKYLFYLVIILLLITNGITFGLFIQSKTKDTLESFVNPYPLIDPARSIVSQEHFFSTIEPLRLEMKEIVEKYEKEGSRAGVYFEFLNTGSNVSINQEERFWPASLSKMPTALAVMKKVENGDWKLTNELVLFYEDRNDGFGTLYKKPAGTRLTIKELLKELLINSDDTAHRILIRNLSAEDFEKMLLALGMEEIYDQDYNITAKEYSRIFRALYNSSYLKRENSSIILDLLSQTSFNDFLNAGLPGGVIFSHKIGEHDPEFTYLDSGVVYFPQRPYLITVMVETKNSGGRDTAEKIMKEISNAAYMYVKNN